MSIKINPDKCVGCKKCLNICPGNLIKFGTDGRAYMKYPDRCWGCVSCVKECKFQAIQFFLGADMGGLGGSMVVESTKNQLQWHITRHNGELVTIAVNRQDANKY